MKAFPPPQPTAKINKATATLSLDLIELSCSLVPLHAQAQLGIWLSDGREHKCGIGCTIIPPNAKKEVYIAVNIAQPKEHA